MIEEAGNSVRLGLQIVDTTLSSRLPIVDGPTIPC